MALFKKYPAFFSSIIVLLLIAVGGLTYIFIAAGQSSDARKKLDIAENNLRSALALSPAPTEANLEASKENVANLKQVFADQIASTKGTNAAILEKKPPTTNTNMYYDLLAYKNELDKDAKLITPIGKETPGVSVPEGFNWGFSRFLQAGAGSPPPENAIPALFRQKTILNYLLRKLLATQPQSIVSVQREPVTIDKAAAATAKPASNNTKSDLKTDEFWMGTESAAIPGVVTTSAYRISFTGYSQNLRAFLKEIAAFELPLVVRSVEVKPVEKAKVAANARAAAPADIFSVFGAPTPAPTEEPKVDQEPVVDTNISEFTVVIEYVDVTVKS